jgi:hypothetical protein
MLKELVADKKYYIFLVLIIIFCTILNYEANLMNGIVPYYENFSLFFKNGFRYNSAFLNNIYTWPMWGYGFIILIFKYKILIILAQQSLTISTIILVRQFLRTKISPISFKIFSIFIFFALPWFFFHTSLWPYSFSANLLVISILYLSKAVDNYNLRYLLFSGSLWGIMLNLRSDYFYLTFLIFFILIYEFSSKIIFVKKLKFAFIWTLTSIIMLIPWGFYSYKYSNNFSLVSTNTGHVIYISLGQLPNNKWKITPSDDDSSMYNVIQKNNQHFEHSLTSKSNKLLKEKFFQIVKNDPSEYLKKCINNTISLFLNPFYIGSFHEKGYSISNLKKIKIKGKILFNERKYLELFEFLFNIFGINFLLTLLSYMIGTVVFYIGLFGLANNFLFKRSFFKSLSLIRIITVVFIYQIILNTFAYNLPIYTTNIYLLILILNSFLIDWYLLRRKSSI